MKHGSADWHFWLIGFALTLTLEAPVVLTVLRRSEPSLRRRFVLFVVANLATHPLVWFFFERLPLAQPVWITLAELWAFSAEAIIYWQLGTRTSLLRATLTSFAANACSFGLGLVIVMFWGRWLFQYR